MTMINEQARRVSSILGAATFALMIALAAAACTRGGQQPVEHGGGQEADPAPLLRITHLVVEDGEDPLMTLTDEGHISGGTEAELTGTLSPEGRLVDPQGTLLGTLHPDGRFIRGDGTVAATIDADGTVTVEELGGPLTLGDDGSVLQGGAPLEGLRVQGLNQHNRRAAGLLVYLTAEGIREVIGAIARTLGGIETTPGIDDALRRGEVDCSRIDDPAYRQQMLDVDIDPDSIDCNECDGCEE
jgi:hypothetical protein